VKKFYRRKSIIFSQWALSFATYAESNEIPLLAADLVRQFKALPADNCLREDQSTNQSRQADGVYALFSTRIRAATTPPDEGRAAAA
jgi:hypothetical protein